MPASSESLGYVIMLNFYLFSLSGFPRMGFSLYLVQNHPKYIQLCIIRENLLFLLGNTVEKWGRKLNAEQYSCLHVVTYF